LFEVKSSRLQVVIITYLFNHQPDLANEFGPSFRDRFIETPVWLYDFPSLGAISLTGGACR
jgi:hypothetical protein